MLPVNNYLEQSKPLHLQLINVMKPVFYTTAFNCNRRDRQYHCETLFKNRFFLGNNTPQHSKWNKTYDHYYSLFLFIAFTAFSIVPLYWNFLDHYPTMSNPEIFIDFLACSPLKMQGTAITMFCLTHSQRWAEFITKIRKNPSRKEKTCYLFLFLGIAHCMFISKTCWEDIAWNHIDGNAIERNYVYTMVHQYYAIFITCFIVQMNAILKRGFWSMNESLKWSNSNVAK